MVANGKKGGQRRSFWKHGAPSKHLTVEWVKEAWAMLASDIIKILLPAYGITTPQPDEIHCMKEDIAPEARTVIQNGWQDILNLEELQAEALTGNDTADAGEETEVDEEDTALLE